MATTLLLDRPSWDLCLDANGSIALASEPYSQVQSVASACRLFRGDAYYQQSIGIPYFEQVLGQFQPIQVVKAFLVEAALSVPGVTAATAVLSDVTDRRLTGQIQFTTRTGVQVASI